MRPPVYALVNPIARYRLFLNGKAGNTTMKYFFFENLGFYDRLFSEAFFSAFGPRLYAAILSRPTKIYRLLVRRERLERDIRFLATAFTAHAARRFRYTHDDGFHNIAVVRNPFDRAVSAYLDKFCGAERRAPWVRRVIDQGGTAGAISFVQFLRSLDASAPETLDGHWRPQWLKVRGIHLHSLVRLETLRQDFAALAPVVGERGTETLPQARQVTRHAPLILPEAWRLSNEELAALAAEHRGLPDKRLFLTEETIVLIRRVYRQDFVRFGYPLAPVSYEGIDPVPASAQIAEE